MTLVALALLTIIPANGEPVTERVDALEVNAYYDDCGKLVFEQLVGWDWYECREEHCVRFWRLIKTPDLWPQRDWRNGDWVVTWNDGEIIRTVRAKSYRKSFTQYDVELFDRERLPKARRRELLTPKP